MNIAICDDDSKITDRLKGDIATFFMCLNEDVEVSVFANGMELLYTIKKEENYDLILLDVDMPCMSGLEAANQIRKNDEDVIIIFISSYENYVFDSFEYNPFRYIRKSRIKEELNLALKSAYMLYNERKKRYIVIKSQEGDYKIEHSKISYFEIVKRKLIIHLADNQILSIWKSINDFIAEINDDAFVKIHKGCAVNLKYIKEYTNYDVTLDNGVKLIVSRSGIKKLKEKLTRYWGGHV